MARTTRSTRFLAALGIAILTVTGIGSAAHAAPARIQNAFATSGSIDLPCLPIRCHPAHVQNVFVAWGSIARLPLLGPIDGGPNH
jgi:hypothetical protein